MGQLTQEEFFFKLSELFATRKGKDHGGVYLLQKRLTHHQEAAAPIPSDPARLPVLIRATNGKGGKSKNEKIKLSTVVETGDLEAFYGRYAELCKGGMAALKPRDRTKRKAKAKKKRIA